MQPPLARLAQQRPHATDELAVARVRELACTFTRAEMRQEIDRVLAAQRTRLIAPVAAQPQHRRQRGRHVHRLAQRVHVARNQPLKVPLLGGLPKPRLSDRAVVNPLAPAVGTQDPHSPHVHRKLALGIAQQPLDRDAQLPAKLTTTVARRHPKLVQQRGDACARDQIDGTLQMASAHPGVATIQPELLKRVEDLQPDALAQRREIDFARRLAVTTQARARKLRQIRLASGHPAPVTGLAQARSPERRQVAAPTAAPQTTDAALRQQRTLRPSGRAPCAGHRTTCTTPCTATPAARDPPCGTPGTAAAAPDRGSARAGARRTPQTCPGILESVASKPRTVRDARQQRCSGRPDRAHSRTPGARRAGG